MKYCFSIYLAVDYAIEKVQENQEGQKFEYNISFWSVLMILIYLTEA